MYTHLLKWIYYYWIQSFIQKISIKYNQIIFHTKHIQPQFENIIIKVEHIIYESRYDDVIR